MENIPINIKNIGLADYCDIFAKMSQYTKDRNINSTDELWCLEHNPVFTQGKNGKPEHLLHSPNIPLVQSDRGGQITYHGPGQAIIYFLFDLKHIKTGIKDFVSNIEKTCIQMLDSYKIKAHTIENAHGIYVDNKKIASVGLRVKNKCTYHGIAINTNMDLKPFQNINPCGYKDLKMCQISDFNQEITINDVFRDYTEIFVKNIGECNKFCVSP